MKLRSFQIAELENMRSQFQVLESMLKPLREVLYDPQYVQPNLSREQSATYRKAHRAALVIDKQKKELREKIADMVLGDI